MIRKYTTKEDGHVHTYTRPDGWTAVFYKELTPEGKEIQSGLITGTDAVKLWSELDTCFQS